MDIIRTWFNGIVIASLGTVSIPVILLWSLFVPFLDVPGLVVTVKFTNETPAQPEVEEEVEAEEEAEEEEEETVDETIPEEEEEEKPADDTVPEDDDVPDEKPADDTIPEAEKPVDETVPEEETRADPNLIETIMTEWNANKVENTGETDKEKSE